MNLTIEQIIAIIGDKHSELCDKTITLFNSGVAYDDPEARETCRQRDRYFDAYNVVCNIRDAARAIEKVQRKA